MGCLGCAIGTSGSFGAAGLIDVRPGGCRVRWGSLGSFGLALVVVRFGRCRRVHRDPPWVTFGVAGFIGVWPGRHWLRWGSYGLLDCALGSRWSGLWVNSEAPRRSSDSFGIPGFIGVRTWVADFFRVRCVDRVAPWPSSGSFGFFGM